MADTSDRERLKRQALLTLAETRTEIGDEISRLRDEWHPRNLIVRSFEKHRAAYLTSAVIAGVAGTRWLFSSRKNNRDMETKPAKKRTLTSSLLSSLWNVARDPLLSLATQQVVPLVLQQISKFQSPPKPERPE